MSEQWPSMGFSHSSLALCSRIFFSDKGGNAKWEIHIPDTKHSGGEMFRSPTSFFYYNLLNIRIAQLLNCYLFYFCRNIENADLCENIDWQDHHFGS